MLQKIRPPQRGIPYATLDAGVMPNTLPGTAPACYAWAPFADQLLASTDPLGSMYEIADAHFAYREHGYQWVVALFASTLRSSMVNRVLGCGRWAIRNRTRRGRAEAIAGLSEEDLAARPEGYVIPNSMRSMQFARRSRILPDLILKDASVVEYLRALAADTEATILPRLQAACSALFYDALTCSEFAAPMLHVRLLLTITYLCAGRPDEIAFGTMRDDVLPNVMHWNVMIRSAGNFYSLNGTINK